MKKACSKDTEGCYSSIDSWRLMWSKVDLENLVSLTSSTSEKENYQIRSLAKNVSDYKFLSEWLNQAMLSHFDGKSTLKELLSTDENRKDLCGYVFQVGDIAFNCRNCQADDTCVLCFNCYQNSNHEGHDVYFHRTSPGGMCDCGDPEAWAVEGFCKFHGGSSTTTDADSSSSSDGLPLPISTIGKHLITDAFDIIVATFHASHRAFVPDELSDSPFIVRIHNDDVNTDDALVQLLSSIRFPGPSQFTSKVDAEGVGTLKTFSEWEPALKMHTDFALKGWQVGIVNEYHESMESLSESLLSWLTQLVDQSPMLQSLVAQVLFTNDRFRTLMKSEVYCVKPLVVAFHNLCMHLIGEKTIRSEFSIQYIQLYRESMEKFLTGVGTGDESIFNFGVQLFTTPSLVMLLSKEHDLFNILIGTLNHAFKSCVEEDADCVEPWHLIVKFKRYSFLLRDLEYSLKISGEANRFVKADECFSTWLSCVSLLQGMNSQKRLPDSANHVEFEEYTWIHAFNLHLNIVSTFPCVLQGLLKDEKIDHDALEVMTRFLFQAFTIFHEKHSNELVETKHDDGDPNCSVAIPSTIKYCVKADPVSFHYPLHSFFAHFVICLLNSGYMNGEAFSSMNPDWGIMNLFSACALNTAHGRSILLTLVEYPLRSFVLNAQIHAGMWRRNGVSSMLNQKMNYFEPPLCRSMRDMDLFLLQFGALHLGAEFFLVAYLDRFEMLHLLSAASVETSTAGSGDDEKNVVLTEECLLFLIWIVTELPRPACIEEKEALLRREVVHRLALEDCLRSTLVDCAAFATHPMALTKAPSDNSVQLNKILNIVAERKEPSKQDQPSKFHLKDEFMHEYDPAFYHLKRSQHEKTQMNRQEKMKADVPLALVGEPPNAHSLFADLRNMLCSRTLVTLIRRVLYNVLHSVPHKSSEVLLLRALHLLTLGVYQIRNKESHIKLEYFEFLLQDIKKSSSNECIASMLESLLSKEPAPALSSICAIKWLLQQYSVLDPDRFSVFWKPKQNEAVSSMDESEKKARRKKMQQLAMERMKKQQASFSSFDMGDDEEELKEEDTPEENLPDCINCNAFTPSPLVYVGFAQRSRILERTFDSSPNLVGNHTVGLHIHSCGHALHQDCAEKYLESLHPTRRINMMMNPTLNIGYDSSKGEFVCPMCKTLCNMLLPVVSTSTKSSLKKSDMGVVFSSKGDEAVVLQWFDSMGDRLKTLTPAPVLHPSEFSKYLKTYAKRLLELRNGGEESNSDSDALRSSVMWEAVAYTVRSEEIAKTSCFIHNDQGKDGDKFGLLEGTILPESSVNEEKRFFNVVQALHYISHLYIGSDFENSVVNPIGLMFSRSTQGDLQRSWKDAVANLSPLAFSQPLLLCDMLTLVVAMLSCMSDKAEVMMMIRSLCVLNGIQVLIRTGTLEWRTTASKESDVSADDLELAEALTSIRQDLLQHARISMSATAPVGIDLVNCYRSGALVFLRQVTILSRVLLRDSTEFEVFGNSLMLEMNYDRMMQQLGVPTISRIRKNRNFMARLQGWAAELTGDSLMIPESVYKGFSTGNWTALQSLVEDPKDDSNDLCINQLELLVPLPYRLQDGIVQYITPTYTTLPHAYTDLHVLLASEKCPVTGKLRENPAICLICGAVMCAATACCRKPLNNNSAMSYGACTRHAAECSASTGIFFVLRRCSTMIIYEERACHSFSIYLDSFGEEDINLRRGRPLYLNLKRLSKLKQLYASHQIPGYITKERIAADQIVRNGWY